ncbi:vegetative cell wall protein [Streptomyces albireticuli]|uniref:Vegetative cell wall protein n=1 Tax=Streptomyces albireticuli TaxID=1940 RepID=A0A2A2D1R1_9ACTN|nr:vegetative cell wall protein [Streptomyces albireticuli]MCD9145875.1 glycosyltransferase family 1 protein [Streptomyces albireticuli]MCD9166138.1 glycosyltransferase family 1 protein [Streptomyces albireticuli]MCD9189640.1 glycosyltransferase family 1 protein [Streptomyces albireticuli]PAU45349.1 vegetative cell wall protein [Streptomyces albireticuli]
MRLLYLLNISNPGRLSADSGFTFADLLTPALADAGVDVTVAAPAPAGDARVGFAPTVSPSTKYRARLDPGLDELVALVRRVRPEAVVANQIEAAPAIRAALLEAGTDARIAGYCHYLPFSFTDDGELLLDPSLDDGGLGRPVLLAFAAGLAACDRVLVHSATAASWTTAAADRMSVELAEKLHVVPAPRDERLVRDPADVSPPDGRATGVYNHRLYAHYGTARFTALARHLVAEAPVELTVMDLLGTRSPERVRLDPSPEQHRDELAALDGVTITSDRGDRIRYRNLLASAHFGIAPFRPGCPWSMSVVDCQGMGLPVIAPRTGWLAEHIDDDLLFDTDDQAVQIARRLATDAEFYRVHAKRAHATTADFAPAAVAARYLEAIA